MTDDTQAEPTWKPPYLSYATLTGFIDKKCANTRIPPQIDKSFVDNFSGGVQALLLATLKLIGFIDEDGVVNPLLHRAAKSPDARKDVLREWAREFYVRQIELAEQGATSQKLQDSFASTAYKGSTMRKAIVFYLTLTDDLELPKSEHFKAPKQASSGRTNSKRASSSREPVTTPPPPGSHTSGETKTITIGNAGTVTISVDVRWLDLADETFVNLRKAIREIESLETPNGGEQQTSEPDDREDSP